MDNVTMHEHGQAVTPGNEKPRKPACKWCGFERTGGNVLNAAPELLASLAAMVDEFDGKEWSPSTIIVLNCAKVAIAKAEGRL